MADINSFLPEDYLEKRVQRRTNLISLSLFAVVMVGVVGAFLVTDRQRTEVRAMQKQVNDRFEEAARRIDQLDVLQNQKDQMVRKAKVTAMLLERVPRSLMLAELINNMPSSIGLITFTLDTHVVKTVVPTQSALDRARGEQLFKEHKDDPAPPDQTEVEIQMVGLAPTDVQVAQFMTSLSKSQMFTDVNLGFSEEITVQNQTMRKFRVDLKLNQDLDITKLQPKMVKRELIQNPMAETVTLDGNKQLNDSQKSQPPTPLIIPTHN